MGREVDHKTETQIRAINTSVLNQTLFNETTHRKYNKQIHHICDSLKGNFKLSQMTEMSLTNTLSAMECLRNQVEVDKKPIERKQRHTMQTKSF